MPYFFAAITTVFHLFQVLLHFVVYPNASSFLFQFSAQIRTV